MHLVDHFRDMARNNAWSNDRLLRACARLTPGAFAAERVSFFPSLRRTLNHVLTVDWYYLDGLEGGGRGYAVFDPEVPHPDIADLAPAQRAADRRLVAFCDAQTPASLGRVVGLDRGERGIKHDTVAQILAHLFVHQIHHRGQVHAMLAGTDVKPPQIDEFFLTGDARASRPEIEALGLAEGWQSPAVDRA